MRRLNAVVIASIFVTGLASAQLKVQQSTPQGTTTGALVPSAPAASQPSLESARRINREEAMKLVKSKKAIFVDVRSKESYEQGHIKGSISIPLSELLTRLREIPPHKMIITYCA